MTIKLIKFIRYTAITIIILCIFTLAYCGYQNLLHVRNSTSQLNQSINSTVLQWIKSDSETTEMLERTDKNLADTQLRLEALGVEFD